MQRSSLWVLGPLIFGILALWCRPAQATSSWRLVGWSGTRISAVTVSPQHAQELAIVADGILELSHDGGVVWLPCVLPARVDVVAYDPVQAGWLYVGSDTGLYVSHDNGISWQRFEPIQTIHKLTVAITVDNRYVFASMYDGAGTAVRVFRITRDGIVSDTGFPDGNADCFAVDSTRQRLYVGSANGVYWSDDEGQSWQSSGHGAGGFTNRIVVKPGAIWQLSADGLFRSHDDGQSWDRLAGPADLNGTYYGSSMHLSGLAVSGESAYYGAWSIGFPYQFLAAYAGGSAHSVFDGRVNEVAIAAGHLWIATDNGLWLNDSLAGSEAAVRRPVLIIPGILGSLPTTTALEAYATAIVEEGYWDHSYKTPLELDPIDHTYDGLINYLLARGYQRDKTLFVFPYNWMQSNSLTASQLSQKLYDVRQACGCSQVDVVAHSMGGLIARSYIQSDAYQGDVANLIELASPNAGAVEDYGVWEGGEFSGITTPNRLLNAILQALAGPQTDNEKVVLLRQFMPSIGQLLPVFDYLIGRQYPTGYPSNHFLEDLNQPSEITRLKQRTALYVVGGDTKPTLQSLSVGAPHPGDLAWPDGVITANSLGLGDGTVPQLSLEAIDKASLLVDADHGGVVSAAAPFVAQTLMGGYVDEPDGNTPAPVPASSERYVVVYVSGTVALRLVAADGRFVDDSAITIPGAYYSGSATIPQLMAIPDPSPDTYRVVVTGSGAYTVGVMVIDSPDVTSSDNTLASDQLTGTITEGEAQQFVYIANSGSFQRSGSSLVPLPSSNPPKILPDSVTTNLMKPWSAGSLLGAINARLPIVVSASPSGRPRVLAIPSHHLEVGTSHGWWIIFWVICAIVLAIILVLRL
jgi:hypothetical protein